MCWGPLCIVLISTHGVASWEQLAAVGRDGSIISTSDCVVISVGTCVALCAAAPFWRGGGACSVSVVVG